MTETPRIAGPRDAAAVEVTGDDRVSYLQAVLSQDVAGLSTGEVAGALHLDGKGRPLALMDVIVLEGRILLLVPEQDLAEELATTLGGRTFLADASFRVLEDAVVAVRGDGLPGPGAGKVSVDDGVISVGREHGLDLVGPEELVEARVDELGAAPASPEDLESWRIAHGVPAWAREVRTPHLPEEMGLLPTHVHLQKGCYPGQEAVARMWNLGRPRRRLASVIVHGDIEPGWTTGGGRQQVELTSATTRDGTRVGLAYVPPDADPGVRYGDQDEAVVVRELVGEDRPVPGHDPSVPRRRDR